LIFRPLFSQVENRVKAIVLVAGVFAKVDEHEILQEETLQAICDTGVRAIGPNTSGETPLRHLYRAKETHGCC